MNLDPEEAEELFDDDREDQIDDIEIDPFVRIETDPAGYSVRIVIGDNRKMYELNPEDRVELLDSLAEREDIGDGVSIWNVIEYPMTTIEILES